MWPKPTFYDSVCSIRLRTPCIAPARATIAGDIAPHGVTGTSFNESLGGVESRHAHLSSEATAQLGELASQPSRRGRGPRGLSEDGVAPIPRDLSPIPPQPFAMSGQLASSGFIVVARSFYSSAHFPSSRFNENPSRNDSDLLPGVFCRMRASSPHVGQSIMRRFENVQKVSEGSYV